jgi:hypothetical protein
MPSSPNRPDPVSPSKSKNLIDRIFAAVGEEEPTGLIIRFSNRPSSSVQRLSFSTALCLEESKHQRQGNYTSRLDRRPENQGGPQLHVTGPRGQQWAHRHTGTRSEPHKYTLRTTNPIRDIVSNVFNIPRSMVESFEVVGREGNELIVEVSFS